MTRLLISSGRGPAECERVVLRLADLLVAEATRAGVTAVPGDRVPGEHRDGAKSVVLQVTGPQAGTWAQQQTGPVCWVSPSPLRPGHSRKNWFVEVSLLEPAQEAVAPVSAADVRFQPVRGSGPGGQHRNKVATGVRATHLPSGVSVVATDSRSQQANREQALRRIAAVLAGRAASADAEAGRRRRQRHDEVTRGNPVRRIVAPL